MKKVLLPLSIVAFFLLGAQQLHAQVSKQTAENLYYTAKVWGYLKYFHPSVSGCNKNMDSILIALTPRILASTTNAEFNTILGEMFSFAGPMPIATTPPIDLTDREQRNLNLGWLDDPYLSLPNREFLNSINTNFRMDSNCYYGWNWGTTSPYFYEVGEKSYGSATSLQSEYKLLLFFRYWNIVNYHYPYKYAMDVSWDSTLVQFIPKCIETTNQTSYHLFFGELQSRLNDAHAFTSSSIFATYFGSNFLPCFVIYTEGKTVVKRVFDASSGIKVGDVILEIDGVPIQHYRDSIRRWSGGSNPASVERNINGYVVRAQSTDAKLILDDGSGPRTVETVRSFTPSQYYDSLDANPTPIWYKLQGNVGYVDMGRLTVDMVEEMYTDLHSTKAIVFDVRNYPQGTMYEICKFIMPDAQEFVKFTYPDPYYPGTLYYQENGLYCGPDVDNPDWYKGQVFILFNEETQSHAEFTIMSLETHPNAIKVGSQTAGADGNVIAISMPTAVSLYYTSIGVYYPDWKETQRVGIVPDVEVRPTVDGIRAGKDEVLDAALSKLSVEPSISLSSIADVFPNPFDQILHISIPANQDPHIEVEIFDVLGRNVYSETLATSSTGELQIQLDDALASGSYLLKIVSDGKHYSKMVIKQ